MNYLYFSRKWTNKNDAFLTFWGPNSSGYRWFEHEVGTYETRDEQEDIWPDHFVKNIPLEKAEPLFELFLYDGRLVSAIANTPENRKALGLKLNKNDFQRSQLSCSVAQVDNLHNLRVKAGPCLVNDEGGKDYEVEGVQTFSIVTVSGSLCAVRSLVTN